MNRFFKVKYGYAASEQISIPESDLEKAIYAQVKGVPVQLGNAFVNGKHIISITPHWHKHTGWYDSYEPTSGDDFAQIKRDCPNYDGIVEHYKNRVVYLMAKNPELIGKNVEIPELQAPQENRKLTSGVKSISEILK